MDTSFKSIIEDLETVKKVFDSVGVRFYLTYGFLLGMYRDGRPLPGDDDVDITVIDKISLKERKQIGWKLYDLGFKQQEIAFNVFGRMEPAEIGYNGDDETGIIVCQRKIKFTIFFFKEEECNIHGREYVCVPKLGSVKLISTPVKFFQKADVIKISGIKYLTPSPIKDYLSFTYFNNWKDKTDRRHGETYPEMHLKNFISYENANTVEIK
jgi:hypothetical protein